jgi:NADH dehydrogenase
MKSIDDALELRGRIFGAFERAEIGAAKGEDVDAFLTFAVVGAGPTGVELAGQIAELAARTLPRDFRHINTRTARVVLIDGAPQVLPPFGPELGPWAQRSLEKAGVEVSLGALVDDVDARGMEMRFVDGRTQRVEAVTKIWAAGVQASELGRTLSEQTGAALDRAGRIAVNPDLTLPGHPEVFVVGDMISLAVDGKPLPGVAQVAMQGGKFAAKAIQADLAGRPRSTAFRYFDRGSMATIRRFSAVAQVGRFRFTGFLAWMMWLFAHLAYLTGFQNRLTATMAWSSSFIGRSRSERTTTSQQVYAWAALEQAAARDEIAR